VAVRIVVHHPEQLRFAWRDLELDDIHLAPWQLSVALGLKADLLHDGGLMFGIGKPLIRLEARSDALPDGWTWTNEPPAALPEARPWQRPGWFSGAWARLGKGPEAGPARLLSTSDLGAVLSVGEDAGRIFLKVGAGREAAVTAALWSSQPELLPSVLSTDLERGELITQSGGETLEKVGDLRAWTGAVQALARYHRSAGVPGVPLHRFEELPERGEALLRDGAALRGWGLSTSEIGELAAALPELRRRHRLVSALGLPDGPVHGDSHGMNALWDRLEARWFDWSEAGVAHPFTDVGWLFFHSADRTWPISAAVPDLRARLADGYLKALELPGAHRELESAEVMALWHRAVVYDATFRAWPEPRPRYVPLLLSWLLKSLGRLHASHVRAG
jgi:Phosphotransferase enzyme family